MEELLRELIQKVNTLQADLNRLQSTVAQGQSDTVANFGILEGKVKKMIDDIKK